MQNEFVDLRDIDSLDRFFELSNETAVVIFKHSETCGISDRAYREMSDLARRLSALSNGQAVRIGIVPVQSYRDVSNEIEVRTGIDHESPQVFVIAGRRVVWSSSHGGVRAEAIEKVLREAVSRNDKTGKGEEGNG
ncbi:MAG TPA: bacillithiol system redox-active protein YtxJ [Pyrinomonadaceae bacterium]|nr:bacillithiol system redox-active protein YtxJ [Pyrinomonadaceae bacterium]